MKSIKRTPIVAAAAALSLAMLTAPMASADNLYWTNTSFGEIDLTTTPPVPAPATSATTVAAPYDGSTPDSVIFTGNQMIFTTSSGVWEAPVNASGVVTGAATPLVMVSPTVMNNTPNLQDLTVDPTNSNSILVSQTGTSTTQATLWRINLNSPSSPVQVGTYGTGVGLRGLTFVGSQLFAVVGSNLEQLNPTNGAVIGTPISLLSTGQNPVPVGGDGLTYDPISGNLFVASAGGNTVWEVNTSLTSETAFTCAICSSLDGIVADGNGNIDVADASGASGQIVQLSESSSTFSQLAITPGIDDLAPLTGLGADVTSTTPTPSSVPEPSSLALLLVGTPLLFWRTRRKAVN